MKVRNLISSVVMLTVTLTAHAQDAQDGQGSLDTQFQQLKESSETFNQYKVIPRAELNGFWNVVQDSIDGYRQDINEAQNQIVDLKDQITNLKTEIEDLNNQLETGDYLATHIKAFGIDFQKTAFISITTAIILALIVLLGISIYRSKDSVRKVSQFKKELDAAKDELEDFRHRSLEKQRKLSRELQTERNKLDELLSKR